MKLFDTQHPSHLSQLERLTLSSSMKALMLSDPLKLTTMLLREEEQPVKPLTPLVRLKKDLGRAILQSWHSLQFQACTLKMLSQAIADMQAIQRATPVEQAALAVEKMRHKAPNINNSLLISRYVGNKQPSQLLMDICYFNQKQNCRIKERSSLEDRHHSIELLLSLKLSCHCLD